jgi:hypothetical protein
VLVAVGVLVIGGSMAWAALTVSFYDVIQTDEWATPAPGPSGVTQYGSNMLIVDTDANNYWDEDTGVDVWEITPGGTVVSTWSTGFEAGVAEPTGIHYDADNDRLFITNDDGEYYIFEPGDDGVFGNGDPTPQAHTVPGSGDAEDPVYDFATNRLYVLDGGGSIFALTPETGALVATIDLGALGPTNWEGLAMTPTGELLVGANVGRQIFVISTDGEQLQPPIDVSDIQGETSGLTLLSGMGTSSPGAGGAAYDIWIADRQSTSNSDDPADVDGRLWRLSTNGTPPPPTGSTSSSSTTPTTTPGGTATTTTPDATSTTTTNPGATTTTPGSQPPDPDPDLGFVDIAGSGFANAIEWLADEGITKGCNPPANTMFCPDDFVTRGQMATFLVRAFGYTDNGGGNLFIDDNSSVFEGAIDKLATAGITVGCNPPDNDRFCPDRDVTRGEMAAFLGRAFGYTDNGGGDWFIDDDGSVFENAIDRLRTAGVTQGCNPPLNNRYCPNDFVTRGQMAAFLKRALGA